LSSSSHPLEEIATEIERHCAANPQAASLLLLVGVPGSGKSSLARFFVERWPNCTAIATDAIRARLYGDAAAQGDWSQISTEIDRCLRQARQRNERRDLSRPLAVYDATNAAPSHRRQAIAQAHRCGFPAVLGVWIDVPLSVARTRNRRRSRCVPDTAIRAMYRGLRADPPTTAEGFDRVWRCDSGQLRPDSA